MKKNQLTILIVIVLIAAVLLTVFGFVKIFDRPEPNNNEQTGSDITENNSQPEPEPQPQPEPEPTDEPTDEPDEKEPVDTVTELPATLPKSYKEFSLTKDMSASEAYEYLDSFLSSKYSILVNKQNKVASTYEPTDLTRPSGSDYKMEAKAAAALDSMLSAARADGYSDLVFYSGYRTYASQKNKYETRTKRYLDQGYSQTDAEAKAGEYIAPPGSSEHHTGLAADVCSSAIVSKYGYLSDEFDATDEWEWLNEHCTEYGFILRYRKDAEDITGFLYEPWHFRYIGVDHAKACTELGVTYEEYYLMLVSFRDEAKNA